MCEMKPAPKSPHVVRLTDRQWKAAAVEAKRERRSVTSWVGVLIDTELKARRADGKAKQR